MARNASKKLASKRKRQRDDDDSDDEGEPEASGSEYEPGTDEDGEL